MRYGMNHSKITRELGWKPLHNLDEWLEKTIQWYVENKEWWRKIKEEDYSEILHNNLGGARVCLAAS